MEFTFWGKKYYTGRLTDEQVSDRISNYAFKRIKLSKRLRVGQQR